MAEGVKYAAFISYSSKDGAFARRLHRALEHYGVPGSLGRFQLVPGGKKNRIYPIFRDREELAPGDLGERIRSALTAAESLVVICSPNAAQSPWVQKEIEYFAGLGRRDRVFAIIADSAPLIGATGGDPTATYFPQALRGENEAVASDARKGKDGFRNAWLKLVAGVIGVNAGALKDRDRARRARNAVLASVAGLAFAGTAGWLTVSNLEIARRNADSLGAVAHYEERAADIRAALESPESPANTAQEQDGDSSAAQPSSTTEDPQQASSQIAPQAIATTSNPATPYGAGGQPMGLASFALDASPTSAPVNEETRRQNVLQAISSWEERNQGSLESLRAQFEALHQLHVAALRNNQITRAAVLASQINVLLEGRQISYFSEQGGEDFRYTDYNSGRESVDASALDIGELRTLVAQPDLTAGATARILSACRGVAACTPALFDVMAYGDRQAASAAAQLLCRNRPANADVIPGLTGIFGALEQSTSNQGEAAVTVVTCLRVGTPEIVTGLRTILSNPDVYRDGATSYNHSGERYFAMQALAALGPTAASALPELRSGRERALARDYTWPSIEDIDATIAAVGSSPP